MLTAGLLVACSSGPAHDRVVTLGSGLTVTLPAGGPAVTARRVTAPAGSPVAELLAPPEHVTASGRLPGRAVLTFRVGRVRGTPFLAWLDRGQWTAVPSTYDARAGTVSAAVPHFSTWAPFAWATDQLKAWLTSSFRASFGLGSTAEPACGTGTAVPVTDSNPGHHTVGACAARAAGLPDGVVTKIANLRGYPIDLSYPGLPGDQCGQYGSCLQVSPQGDIWLKLGAALSPGSHHVLLPGSSTATAIVAIPAGGSAVFGTAVDSPAMFMAFLHAGVQVFATIVETKLKAVKVAATALDALTASQCTADGWQSVSPEPTLSSAVSLAKAAFGCVSSVVPEVLDKLHLATLGFVVGAFQAAAGFVSAVLSSLWGEIDTSLGAHQLTVGGAAPTPTPASFPIDYPQDMTLACVQQYGPGTSADWVSTISPPSYGVQCFRDGSSLGGLDLTQWCPAEAALHHYDSAAGWYSDNPYRYSPATSTVKPWETWRCYQR